MSEHPRILVVDDEESNRKLLKVILEAEGYEVVLAADAYECLDKVARYELDAMLVDVMMPGLDGIELTRRIKRDTNSLARIPIVALTAAVDKETRLAALEAGADDFLRKPVDRLELGARLKNLVRMKRLGEHGQKESVAQKLLAEQELVKTQSLYRALVETAPDVIMVIDESGVLHFINRPFQRLHVGGSFFAGLEEESKARLQAAMVAARKKGDVITYEVQRKSPDDARTWHSGRIRALEPETKRSLVFTHDITEQKEAELALEESENKLRQAQKMEAIGALAGGVAHDFNNLLTSIISFTRFVSDDLQPGDPRKADLSEVLRAADSASRLTSQLLSFSRRRPVEPEIVDVNEAVTSVQRMLRRTIGETIELVVLLAEDSLPVLIDPGQIDQLLFNLAVNAKDAMPQGGTLTLSTTKSWFNEDDLNTGDLTPGEYATIAIKDTGGGIDPQHLDRIFEPFFSTKGEKGTGLGLATCYGIVRQAGGEISVESSRTKGSVFRVLLPLQTATPLPSAETEVEPQVEDGTGLTALVVEDQPAILEAMSRPLTSAGFSVMKARTAEEGLALLEGKPEPSLLVTDVVLPGLSGIELSERLQRRFPELRVIISSGYMDANQPAVKTSASVAFLPKPFSAVQLRALLVKLIPRVAS